MATIFLICAVAGGTLLVCQFLLAFLGFGDHHDMGGHDFHVEAPHDVGHDTAHDTGHDADHDHEQSWFVGVLSFRSIVAALTFFGIAGMFGTEKDLGEPLTLVVAMAAGVAALALVAFLMKTLYKLRADGTVRIERAVGKSGTVYLTVPGQKAGVGKVTLNLQNRTVEYQAITPEQALPTGAKVVVVSVVSPDTVEVLPATDAKG